MVDKATADKWALEDIERRGRIIDKVVTPAEVVPPGFWRERLDRAAEASLDPQPTSRMRPLDEVIEELKAETARTELGPVTEAEKARAEATKWENACRTHYRRAEDFRKKLNQAEHDRNTAQSERSQHWQEKRDALAETDEAIRERDQLRDRAEGYETALRYFRDIAPRPLAKMIAGVLRGGGLR